MSHETMGRHAPSAPNSGDTLTVLHGPNGKSGIIPSSPVWEHLVISQPTQNGHREKAPERREAHTAKWWQEAVIYQIYPASFRDANGDGFGDLHGITEKLDYLRYLGVDAIWLSPIYPSPMRDGGYDVADYRNIDARFGTLEDFRELIQQAHGRDIRVIMDMVMNHTSNEHPWFKESRDPTSEKRDWYVWADGREDGSPANNWESFFGGSAWTYDEKRNQWYLHKFAPEQPDLNLSNPKVQDVMIENMIFWLKFGVDGIRFDVIDHTFHAEDLSDMGQNPQYQPGQASIERLMWREKYLRPEAYDFVRDRIVPVLRAYNAVGIGEIEERSSVDHLVRMHEVGMDLPFNFSMLHTPMDAISLKNTVDRYASVLSEGTWATAFGNHDQPRITTRIGEKKVPVATMMLLTLPGVPFIYQGDEIGMQNGIIPLSKHRDPQVQRLGVGRSRDPARTPMHWDGGLSAGFSEKSDGLWLPVGSNGNGKNVFEQVQNPDSLFNFTKAMIALRKRIPALSHGRYVPYALESNSVFVFGRATDGQTIVMALNFSQEQQRIHIPEGSNGVILLSTNRKKEPKLISGEIELGPYEGSIIEVVTDSKSLGNGSNGNGRFEY